MTTISLRSRPTGFAAGSSNLTVRDRIRRVYQYRRILKLLVGRDLKVRYAGSFLGYVWTILEPLLMTFVYFLLFTQIFHRSAGNDFKPFLLYLITGQLPFFWFTGGVTATTRALRSESQMVRSTNVPRELWVLRVVASKYVEYLFGLPVVIIFAAAYAMKPTIYTLLLPVAWLLEITLIVGMGLILAPLNVLVRDVERIVPIFTRIMFFASPVLYSIEQASKKLQVIFSLNPTVGFLQLSRAVFFPAALYTKHTRIVGGHVVVDHVRGKIVNGVAVVHERHHIVGGHKVVTTVSHWNWVWHSAVVSLVILVIGVFVFIRLERPVLKEI